VVVQVRQLHTLPGIVVLGLDIAIESFAVVERARQVCRQFARLGLFVEAMFVVMVVVLRVVFHGVSGL
jgi:uncharacterized membrane protein